MIEAFSAPDITSGPMSIEAGIQPGSKFFFKSFYCRPGRISRAQDWPHRRKGLLLAPGFKCVDLRALAFALKLIDSVGQVAQARERFSAFAISRSVGIFTQGDIAPIMGSVFNR